MPTVSPVTSSAPTVQTQRPENPQPQAQSAPSTETPKYEYPISYEQHQVNSLFSDTMGSIIAGGITALVSKAKFFKASTKTAIGIGAGVAACLVAINLFKGLNGEYKEKYINKKRAFENPQKSVSFIA
jgi:hypothetical protein